MNSRPIISDIDDPGSEKDYLSESPSKVKDFNTVDTPLISVVIPLYNEEHSVKKVFERISNHRSYEIIVVDDGSTDNSVRKVKEIKDREIKIIQHEKIRTTEQQY